VLGGQEQGRRGHLGAQCNTVQDYEDGGGISGFDAMKMTEERGAKHWGAEAMFTDGMQCAEKLELFLGAPELHCAATNTNAVAGITFGVGVTIIITTTIRSSRSPRSVRAASHIPSPSPIPQRV
jgi:hypothetical protein